MELILLIVIASAALLILVYLGFLYNKKPARNVREAQNAVPAARDGGPRRAQVVRNRGVRNRARMQREDVEEEDNLEEREADTIDDKLGAKKRAKLEAKAEKKAQREVEERRRQENKKKDQLADEERKKVEEKERVEEKRLEEEQKKIKEEKDRKEYEEYMKMKEAFSVEEEGFEEGIEDEGRNLLQEFVDHIKTNKVVVIEDLAAHFKLKTQAAIDRIQDLLKDNILTGVIDDRGKFIYVSGQEMEAIAKFIKQRGRVSIQELAERSNELINLKPTTVVS